ncbi:S41 family peptidase [Cohnella sp. GCM10027633]|uniref:S41 family peptidase n=1 Tax=unclassified Cohnella TaxID=2636738 RepID=UPI003633636A
MKLGRLGRKSVASLLGIALLIGLTPVASAADTPEQVKEVRQLLLNYHYGNPSEASLSMDDIDGMIKTLNDPYTQFFDAAEWKAFNSVLEQTFVGVGIVMRQEKTGIAVDDVIPGSPAASAGMQAGDVLATAAGQSLKGKSTADVQQLLLGKEGSLVSLTVTRAGKKIDFILQRKTIHLPTVTSRMLGEGVGYLSLSGFTSDAAAEVKKHLEELEGKGMKALVFDLRNNGGGYVDTAQKIAGLFLEEGVLAHMRDREGNDTPLEVDGENNDYPVTLLVNGNSASASELLAGALQDYGIAKLVGTQTYGKGVVQSIVTMQSGGVLKLTIRQYFTPNGRQVDKVGLTPDLTVQDPASQLVEAYRAAGGHKVELTATSDVVTMSGIRTSEPSAAMKNAKGVWYVNIRMGASIAGATLKYDADKRVFTLTKGKVVRTILSNDPRLFVKNGRTMIDVRVLEEWYPGFDHSVSDETIKLSDAG